jgi:ubiquinone/menaquinone biosynthesis C-methylase UbiE
MTKNIGTAFRNADGDQFDRLVRCLDFMTELPFFKTYKSHSWQSLKIEPGHVILDVGCGTGSDLIHLASLHPKSSFIGVDNSENFLAIAKQRATTLINVQFIPGDALQLPIDKESVDAIRIDRSLQHMEMPAAVVKEMVRVTKIGGRIAACEPDWETFLLFNGEFDDSQQIAGFFQRSIRNPFIGRELASLMNEAGVKHLETYVHAFWTHKLKEADVIFDLEKVKDQCAAADMLTQDDGDNWWALSQKASEKGIFFASLNIVETAGVKG